MLSIRIGEDPQSSASTFGDLLSTSRLYIVLRSPFCIRQRPTQVLISHLLHENQTLMGNMPVIPLQTVYAHWGLMFCWTNKTSYAPVAYLSSQRDRENLDMFYLSKNYDFASRSKRNSKRGSIILPRSFLKNDRKRKEFITDEITVQRSNN